MTNTAETETPDAEQGPAKAKKSFPDQASLLKLLASSGALSGGGEIDAQTMLSGLAASGALGSGGGELVSLLGQAFAGAQAAPEASEAVIDADYVDVDLAEEVDDLRAANETLAMALGACPSCWGGDRFCATCRGRGRPGAALPDAELFAELIAPAVARVEHEHMRFHKHRVPRRKRARPAPAPHPKRKSPTHEGEVL